MNQEEDTVRKENPAIDSSTEEPKEQKECFVMMPFGETGNYQEGHFKRVLTSHKTGM